MAYARSRSWFPIFLPGGRENSVYGCNARLPFSKPPLPFLNFRRKWPFSEGLGVKAAYLSTQRVQSGRERKKVFVPKFSTGKKLCLLYFETISWHGLEDFPSAKVQNRNKFRYFRIAKISRHGTAFIRCNYVDSMVIFYTTGVVKAYYAYWKKRNYYRCDGECNPFSPIIHICIGYS